MVRLQTVALIARRRSSFRRSRAGLKTFCRQPARCRSTWQVSLFRQVTPSIRRRSPPAPRPRSSPSCSGTIRAGSRSTMLRSSPTGVPRTCSATVDLKAESGRGAISPNPGSRIQASSATSELRSARSLGSLRFIPEPTIGWMVQRRATMACLRRSPPRPVRSTKSHSGWIRG